MTAGSVGFVIIGRNEGDRLARCLETCLATEAPVVYVDSGSTDGSAERARDLGAEVIDLDMTKPFTAARARNEGLDHLIAQSPGLEFVQFVDGDCELLPDWLSASMQEMVARPKVGVVWGNRLERHPDKTVYNRLTHVEWLYNFPYGDVGACGGDSLMRVEAFHAVDGFDSALISGEEPELCFRLRHAGWIIFHIDADRALHDVDMQRFGQWWKRSRRAGYAFTQGALMHGRESPERYWVRESLSILFWGAALPGAIVLGAIADPRMLAAFVVYPLSVVRVQGRMRKRGCSSRDAWLYAFFCYLSKFPAFGGQLQCLGQRLARRQGSIIEYK